MKRNLAKNCSDICHSNAATLMGQHYIRQILRFFQSSCPKIFLSEILPVFPCFSLILLTISQAGFCDDSGANGIVGAALVLTHVLDGLDATDVTYVASVDQIAVSGLNRQKLGVPGGVEIRLLSNKDRTLVSQTKNHTQSGIGLSGSSSGKTLVAYCLDNKLEETVYVYECTPGGLSLVKQKQLGSKLSFAIPPTYADQKCVLGITVFGPKLEAIDVLSDTKPTTLDTEWDHLYMSIAAVSQQGTRIAIGRYSSRMDEYTLGIWELTGEQLRVVTLPDAGSVSAVDFSADGSSVVTGTSVGKVHTWKVKNDSPIAEREFEVPASYPGRKIRNVRFSADSRIVTAMVGMHRVFGWDTETAKLRFVLYHKFLYEYTWLDHPDAIATVGDEASVDSQSELKVWKLSSKDDEQKQ